MIEGTEELTSIRFSVRCAGVWREFCETIDSLEFGWDNPTMIVTLDAKRRVSIPAALAPAAPGDQFEASFDAEDDVVVLRRVAKKPDWLEVLKSCPVPMDDLPPRSRELPKKLKL